MDTLCIVMPAYNEAECIESVVTSWLAIFEKIPGTFIVINDGSKDRTLEILSSLAKRHRALKIVDQANAGHGIALRRGYEAALKLNPTYVFQTDSDDQFLASDFSKLWDLRTTSPFITGIRAHRSDPLNRKIISKIGVAVNFIFFGTRHPDPNVPYRLFRASLLAELLERIPPTVFAPNILCTVGAEKRGVQIPRIAIGHKERTTGTGSLLRWKLIKVCFRVVGELFRYRRALRNLPKSQGNDEHHEGEVSDHRGRADGSGRRLSS